MNLGDTESAIYDMLGYDTNPDGKIVRRIRRHVNLVHRQLLAMRGLSKLRRMVLSFACVSGSQLATLPQACTMVICLSDRTNRRILWPVSLQDIRWEDPGLAHTSTIPSAFAIMNLSAPVNIDPSAADQLFVKSDSATDGAGVIASVEGIVTGGYFRKASVAMNGVTAVALDANTTWETITKFYLSAPAKGSVTLRQTSGLGTELARITEGRSYSRYTRIALSGIPGSALTYYADVELHVEDMVSPADESLLPEDFHWLLECGALKIEFQKKEKVALWKIEAARFADGVADLKVYVARQGGSTRKAREGFSQLGWAFPAGS